MLRDAEKSILIQHRTLLQVLQVPVLTEDAEKGRDTVGKPTAFSHIIKKIAITTAIENLSSSAARTDRMPLMQMHTS